MAARRNEAQTHQLKAAGVARERETERDAARATLSAALVALSAATAENTADLTAKHDAAKAAHDLATTRLKAAREALTLAETELSEAIAEEEKELAASAQRDPKNRGLQAVKDNVDDDPAKGFATHRDFLASVVRDRNKRSVDNLKDKRLQRVAVFDKDDKESAEELAFMLPAAFTPVGLLGSDIRAAVGSDEQGTYDDRYGGFTVGTSLLPGVRSIGFDGDPTSGRTQSIPMATPHVEMLARVDKDHSTSVSGGFTVTRRPETGGMTASRAQMEKISLRAYSLFGLAYATEELLSDSLVSFLAIINSGFRDQMSAHMLNEKLRGLGGNEYLGILTALATTSPGNTGPTISVAKETGQPAGTIVAMNAVRMASRCWGFGSAIWLANHDTRPQLYTLQIPVGTSGTLLYQPSGREGFPDMLMGRPVIYNEFCSTAGTAGDLILANWGEYLEGLYQPLQSAESVHVRFENHERTLKFWLRNAGAPWWKSPLTPAKSSQTLSPFVVLDTRS